MIRVTEYSNSLYLSLSLLDLLSLELRIQEPFLDSDLKLWGAGISRWVYVCMQPSSNFCCLKCSLICLLYHGQNSHSECINKLTLGICSSNPNGLEISKTVQFFKTKNAQKYSGQFDAIKPIIKANSVIAKVLSYHLTHHSVCLWEISRN